MYSVCLSGTLKNKIWRYNAQNENFTTQFLQEFHDYEFRIVAENKAGKGLPSLPTAPIKIQEMGGSRPEIVVKPEDTAQPYNRFADLHTSVNLIVVDYHKHIFLQTRRFRVRGNRKTSTDCQMASKWP